MPAEKLAYHLIVIWVTATKQNTPTKPVERRQFVTEITVVLKPGFWYKGN